GRGQGGKLILPPDRLEQRRQVLASRRVSLPVVKRAACARKQQERRQGRRDVTRHEFASRVTPQISSTRHAQRPARPRSRRDTTLTAFRPPSNRPVTRNDLLRPRTRASTRYAVSDSRKARSILASGWMPLRASATHAGI